MSITALERLFIFQYSQQILQQDLLTNSLFSGGEVGEALRNMVLSSNNQAKTFTNPYDEAITGRLRSDAATMQQAASNVREAAYIYDIAAEATDSIKSNLERMKEIATGVDDGSMDIADVQAEYESLYDENKGLMESADYNGMRILDGSTWSSEDRITESGGLGQIYIQAGSSGFDISFQDLSDISDDASSGYSYTDLSTDASAALTAVSTEYSRINTIQSGYSEQSNLLESQAESMEDSAEILQNAADNRKSSTSTDIEDVIMDYLEAETGSIVDESA